MTAETIAAKPPDLRDDLPPLEIVRQMIDYETRLRLSDSIQELFDIYHRDDQAIT